MLDSFFSGLWAQDHQNEYKDSEFRIGDLVKVTKNGETFEGEISGVNHLDTDKDNKPIFEYSVNGYPYLLWAEELELITKAGGR